jgi:hypothetical protein
MSFHMDAPVHGLGEVLSSLLLEIITATLSVFSIKESINYNA